MDDETLEIDLDEIEKEEEIGENNEDEEDEEENSSEESEDDNEINDDDELPDKDDDEEQQDEKEELPDSKDDDDDYSEINISELIESSAIPQPKRKVVKIKNKYCKINNKKEPREDKIFNELSKTSISNIMLEKMVKYLPEHQCLKIIDLIKGYSKKKVGEVSKKEILTNFLYSMLGILIKKDKINKFVISLKNGDDYFEFKSFEDEKKEYCKERDIILAELEVIDGVHMCFKCKKSKTTRYRLQCRSSDEPTSTFVRCTNCGNQWRDG